MKFTLICSTGRNNPLSAFMRWLTKGRCSHFVVGFTLGKVDLIYQADIGGLRPITRKRWLKSNRIVAEFGSKVDLTNGFEYALEQMDESYDYAGLLGYLPVLIGRWLHRKVKNPWASPSKLVCVELAFLLNKDKLLASLNDLPQNETTAEDILDTCEKEINLFPIAVS